MIGIFKKFGAVAEVDGITFWSKSAFQKYMLDKERKEKGLHQYTFRALGNSQLQKAIRILEKNGVFDYSYFQISPQSRYSDSIYNIDYWAPKMIIITRTNKETQNDSPQLTDHKTFDIIIASKQGDKLK